MQEKEQKQEKKKEDERDASTVKVSGEEKWKNKKNIQNQKILLQLQRPLMCHNYHQAN